MESWEHTHGMERTRFGLEKVALSTIQLSNLEREAPALHEKIVKRGRWPVHTEIRDLMTEAFLQGPNPEDKEAAAKLLHETGYSDDPRFLVGFLNTATSLDPKRRLAAFTALEGFSLQNSAAALSIVLGGMNDGDPEIRAKAIEASRALGQDLASRLVPDLQARLSDLNSGVRRRSLEALTWLKSEAVDALPAIVHLIISDDNCEIRDEILNALRAIDPDFRLATKSLIALSETQPSKQKIIESLQEFGAPGRDLRHKYSDAIKQSSRNLEEKVLAGALRAENGRKELEVACIHGPSQAPESQASKTKEERVAAFLEENPHIKKISDVKLAVGLTNRQIQLLNAWKKHEIRLLTQFLEKAKPGSWFTLEDVQKEFGWSLAKTQKKPPWRSYIAARVRTKAEVQLNHPALLVDDAISEVTRIEYRECLWRNLLELASASTRSRLNSLRPDEHRKMMDHLTTSFENHNFGDIADSERKEIFLLAAESWLDAFQSDPS